MNNNDLTLLIAAVLGGIIVYLFMMNNCSSSINELNDMKARYAQLNESYNQKVQENSALRIENKQLKEQQKQLSDQIATYLVEQASIDLLGLRKYTMAYDLIKIAICNKNPSIIFC